MSSSSRRRHRYGGTAFHGDGFEFIRRSLQRSQKTREEPRFEQSLYMYIRSSVIASSPLFPRVAGIQYLRRLHERASLAEIDNPSSPSSTGFLQTFLSTEFIKLDNFTFRALWQYSSIN
ncbi:unnamed protein product [Ixodes pacificus]